MEPDALLGRNALDGKLQKSQPHQSPAHFACNAVHHVPEQGLVPFRQPGKIGSLNRAEFPFQVALCQRLVDQGIAPLSSLILNSLVINNGLAILMQFIPVLI